MTIMGKRHRLLVSICLAWLAGCGLGHRPDESATGKRQQVRPFVTPAQVETHNPVLARPSGSGGSRPLAEPGDMRTKKPGKPKKANQPSTETPIKWFTDYTEAVQQARRAGKPLFVVFR